MNKLTGISIVASAVCLAFSPLEAALPVTESPHDLRFPDLARTWDEGMPLGNGMVGSLLWEKDGRLRLSLDRVDLWDLRPTTLSRNMEGGFKRILEHVNKGDYAPIQREMDDPYNSEAGPSKIPGAAVEFDLSGLGEAVSSRLYLKEAVCEIVWKNGACLQSFVHATEPVGFFVMEGAPESFAPRLCTPQYGSAGGAGDDNSHAGADLVRLGYRQGTVVSSPGKTLYHQPCWGDFSYDVAVQWKREGDKITGVWSVTSSLASEKAEEITARWMKKSPEALYKTHRNWWRDFWKRSSVSLPDPVMEKQYYNELYTLGSTARANGYPISLQAVWTADNGKLPPWKGDFHHDLNTQLSYWPVYAGNYLEEGLGYLNTLWNQRETNKTYTKAFFGTSGLNVPGVCTLEGLPMGGWVQYACSPTVSAWLAQHFYLHWKYSGDRTFLKERAYPYLKDVATHLEEFSSVREGVRTLPLSSSPEIHDNSINAWFRTMTNYDLALMKFAFSAAAELAGELNLPREAARWKKAGEELPELVVDEEGGLAFASGEPYRHSHRHFSHAMAIHPLGLLDWNAGGRDRDIMRATIARLDKSGPGAWVGYSYSWLGNMKARARDGEGAAKALKDFAECFCLRNTFHANGDQTGTGKSGFRYRPFTLEGNFAFASGVQEMLLQSAGDVVRVFPAVPETWQDISFDTLRASGAFLVSAERRGGRTEQVVIRSEQGGPLKMEYPFGGDGFSQKGGELLLKNGFLEGKCKPGQVIKLNRKTDKAGAKTAVSMP